MEGFTLVLFISWLVILGCYAAMYYMDQASAKVAQKRTQAAEQENAPRR